MRFRTESGGVYEVDKVSKLIRRLEGDHTTKRATKEWREYQSLLLDVRSSRVLIVWGIGADEVSETCEQIGDTSDPTNVRTRATWTSRVEDIWEDS